MGDPKGWSQGGKKPLGGQLRGEIRGEPDQREGAVFDEGRADWVVGFIQGAAVAKQGTVLVHLRVGGVEEGGK